MVSSTAFPTLKHKFCHCHAKFTPILQEMIKMWLSFIKTFRILHNNTNDSNFQKMVQNFTYRHKDQAYQGREK